jgi:hypothetical protein
MHPISGLMEILAELRRTPHTEGAVIDFMREAEVPGKY